jgi:hypothetical protein
MVRNGPVIATQRAALAALFGIVNLSSVHAISRRARPSAAPQQRRASAAVNNG